MPLVATLSSRNKSEGTAMDGTISTSRPGRYFFDESLFHQIKELGLGLRIEFDMEEWKTFIRGTEWPVVNASVDPVRHNFRPGEVFWLNLHEHGHTVATQVLRIIDTDDYVEMVRDQSIWFGDAPSEFQDARLLADDFPLISGTVVQLSGLYIAPQWRRARTSRDMRLVAAFVRLSHDFTLRNLAADWSVTLIEQKVATPRIVNDLYAYAHAKEAFEAFIPYLGRKERLTMAWMSHTELAAISDTRPPSTAQSHRQLEPTAG